MSPLRRGMLAGVAIGLALLTGCFAPCGPVEAPLEDGLYFGSSEDLLLPGHDPDVLRQIEVSGDRVVLTRIASDRTVTVETFEIVDRTTR
jgi:hypothetical protein